MSIQCQINRNTVLEMNPLQFETHPTAYAGTSTHPRVYVDTLKIFGFECEKLFYANEGGTEANKIKDNGVTASGIIVDFSLAGPQLSAAVDLTVGVALCKNKWDELQAKIETAKNGTNDNPYIEFGESNKLQELKETDDGNKWGLMCDVSNLVFSAVEAEFLDYTPRNLGIQGGSSLRLEYHLIKFSGLMLDSQKSGVDEIPVCHGHPDANGIYPILGIGK